MKTKKLFVETENASMGITITVKDDATKEEIFEEVKEYVEKDGQKVTRIEYQKNRHLCPYCHSITKGTDHDDLCTDCIKYFGHTKYSEL